MDRVTKLLVVGWACSALAVEIWLLSGSWRGLPPFALSVFALAAICTAIDRRAIALVLALTYVCPALVYGYTGNRFAPYDAVWMVALLGALVPAAARSGWHIPGPWRGALVCWALVVALGASIVVAREVDFMPALIHVTTISNTARGGWPSFIVRFVLHSALVLVLGILWFDWLFEASEGKFRFHLAVAGPMAASALGMAAVAVYQLFVDVSFLNPTVYASLGRASGTLFDANVCGTVAALWIGGAVLWSSHAGSWRPYAIVGGMTMGWLAVWASGSRTGFGAAAVVTAFSLVALYVERRRQPAARAIPQVVLAAVGALALITLLAKAQLGVVGPAARLYKTLPEPSVASVRSVAAEMWNRNRYGSTSTAMIRAFPWFGVGIGSFQILLPEFAAPLGGRLPPDNAQNWYRHQFAEFGLFGSLAWIAWVGLFAVFVLSRRRNAPSVVWIGRGVLVAFALISLLGMPGQEISVAMTFWTMAFGYVALVGAPAAAPIGRRAWVGIAAVLVVFVSGTVRAAANELRVPVRAVRGGWAYSYGFYPPEPGQEGDRSRWTRQRAVVVIDARTRWLAVTISANPFRVAGVSSPVREGRNLPIRAVDAKVWCDGRLVVERRLVSTEPVTEYIAVPEGDKRLLLETWVSRVIRPRELGVADDRELGLLVRWDFLDAPPAGTAPSVVVP